MTIKVNMVLTFNRLPHTTKHQKDVDDIGEN